MLHQLLHLPFSLTVHVMPPYAKVHHSAILISNNLTFNLANTQQLRVNYLSNAARNVLRA